MMRAEELLEWKKFCIRGSEWSEISELRGSVVGVL